MLSTSAFILYLALCVRVSSWASESTIPLNLKLEKSSRILNIYKIHNSLWRRHIISISASLLYYYLFYTLTRISGPMDTNTDTGTQSRRQIYDKMVTSVVYLGTYMAVLSCRMPAISWSGFQFHLTWITHNITRTI